LLGKLEAAVIPLNRWERLAVSKVAD